MTIRFPWRRTVALAVGMVAMLLVLRYVVWGEADATERAYCLWLLAGVTVLAMVATGRAALALALTSGLFGLVWYASEQKLQYLAEPLVAPDLRYFLNADTLDVIRKYPPLLTGVLIVGAAIAIVLPLLCWLDSPGWWRGRQRWRVPATLIAALPLAVMLWPTGPFSAAYAGGTWNYINSVTKNPVSGFVRSFNRMALQRPVYDPADAAKVDWGHADAPPAGATPRYPDIVVVLEESTLDPHEWSACDIPECDLRMFHADARTAAHGALEVHTYGGGTWTSEFALFAGMPSTLFGAAGMYAPYNLAPRLHDALPRVLKAHGYRTIAVYPMPRGFVDAGEAYSHYGFDEFIDSVHLGLKWESTDPELLEKFAAIYHRESAHASQPLFFMLLTMRQHGPHDYPLDRLPPPFNQPLFAKLDAVSNRNLGNYLARLQQSDAAITDLEKLVLDGGRPTVLVHFGDHHPSFSGIETKLDLDVAPEFKPVASQLTYYVVKTNLPEPAKHDYPVLDLAYLGGLVLDVAGVPKDDYFHANAQLREHCAGRFTECADRKTLASYYAEVFGRLGIVGK